MGGGGGGSQQRGERAQRRVFDRAMGLSEEVQGRAQGLFDFSIPGLEESAETLRDLGTGTLERFLAGLRTGSKQRRRRSGELWNLGEPARAELFALINNALGGEDILSSRFFNPVAKQIESQTDESRRRLMSMMPQGGSLDRAMIDLESGRVGARADASTRVRQGLFADALNAAFGQTLGPSAQMMGLSQQGSQAGAGMGLNALGMSQDALQSLFGGAQNQSGLAVGALDPASGAASSIGQMAAQRRKQRLEEMRFYAEIGEKIGGGLSGLSDWYGSRKSPIPSGGTRV